MADHLPDVISSPPEITTLEQVPGALKQVADYINDLPAALDGFSLKQVPEVTGAFQTAITKQLSELVLTSLNEAKEGTYSSPDFDQLLGGSEPHKSPELLQALGAIASAAEFVRSAYDEVDFSNTVDPDSHRANEAQSRFDKVMEMLKTNAPSLSLESGLENPEYASQEWFTQFLADHPELDELDDPHDIDGQRLRVYALVGSNKYKEAFEVIDEADGSSDNEKAMYKFELVCKKVAADPNLTIAEGYAAINIVDGWSDDRKARTKASVIIAKLSIVGDREKMAKDLELRFSNR